MRTVIEFTIVDVERLIKEELIRKGLEVEKGQLNLQTKSAQNYKSEWETANFKGTFTIDL